MRKSLSCVAVCLFVLFGCNHVVLAEDVKTTMIIQSSWDRSQQDEEVDSQEALIYWNAEKIAGGIEVYRSQDYLRVRPLAGLRFGPWNVYAGGSFDSENNQFVYPGLDYFGSWERVSVFLSVRQYLRVQGQQESFSDLFLKLSVPLNDSFFAGIDLAGDYYWDSQDEWFLVGPFIGYNLSEEVAIFVRLSRDWTVSDEVQFNDRIRVGVIFNF